MLLGLSLESIPRQGNLRGSQVLATQTLSTSGVMINVLTGWYPESSSQPLLDMHVSLLLLASGQKLKTMTRSA